MPKPRLPVIKKGEWHYPKKALCPWCRTNKVFEPHSMAVLAGGACLLDRRTKVAGPDPRMQGYLTLFWHGAHDGGRGLDPEFDVMVDVVQDSKSGQYDLYFCSIPCLRAFLNACVDTLEARLKKVKQADAKRKRRKRAVVDRRRTKIQGR